MHLKKKIAAMLSAVFCFLVLPFSAFADETKLSITVNIFDSVQYGYLLNNTSLSCPEESTVEDLLQILSNYALIDDYTVEEHALISISAKGTTVTDNDDGNLVIEVNDLAVSLTTPLQDGDAVSISYFSIVDKEEAAVSLPQEELQSEKAVILPHSDPNWNSETASSLIEVFSWLRQQESLPESIIALGSGGIAVEHKTITGLIRSITNGWDSCLTLSRYIIAAGHCSMHAGNINNIDLLNALLNCPDITREEAAWTLLALDCNDYPSEEHDLNGRDAALNYLMAAIGEDGGISPSAEEESDPYLTSLFIIAATPYRGDDSVALAVDNAISYLSAKQRRHGGFEDDEGLSFSALCMSIIALNSSGLSTNDPRFIKSGITLSETLLKFQNTDGGFSFSVGETSSVEASFLGAMALTSMKTGNNPFPLRTKVTGMGSIVLPSPEEQLPPSQPTLEEELPPAFHPVQGVIVGAFLLLIVAVLLLILGKKKKRT